MIREDKTLDIYRFDIVGITIFVSMEKPGYICYNKWKIITYYPLIYKTHKTERTVFNGKIYLDWPSRSRII